MTSVNIEILSSKELQTTLKAKWLDRAMTRGMHKATAKTERRVKSKLRGKVLHYRTGNLRRSITREIGGFGASKWGVVGIGSQAPYGKTHELGLTIFYPKRGISIKFPERSFMRTSLEELTTEIVADFRREIDKEIKKGARE